MAKQKTNKSAAVREILGRNPNTPTKEIMATLAQRGIKVHPNLVYLRYRAGSRRPQVGRGGTLGRPCHSQAD